MIWKPLCKQQYTRVLFSNSKFYLLRETTTVLASYFSYSDYLPFVRALVSSTKTRVNEDPELTVSERSTHWRIPTAHPVENLYPSICMLNLSTGLTISYLYPSLLGNPNFIVLLEVLSCRNTSETVTQTAKRFCHREMPLRFSDTMVNKGGIDLPTINCSQLETFSICLVVSSQI